MDKAEIKYRFRRSVNSYEGYATVQKMVADRLYQLLETYISREPLQILEIGCGTGLLTRLIKGHLNIDTLIINDLVDEMCSKTADRYRLPFSCCLAGDIEEIRLEQTFDLIVSSSTFQWFKQPSITLKKLASHLKTGGILAFSSFGPENFKELRDLTGKGLHYPALSDLQKWLYPCFDILYTEETLHVELFSHPLAVLRHIQKTGVNGLEKPEIWTKGRLERFCSAYARLAIAEQSYPLTYHPVYCLCRKK